MDLRGRIALVTGASSGIGYATALRLAEAGADISLGYGQEEMAGCILTREKRKEMDKQNIVVTLVDAARQAAENVDHFLRGEQVRGIIQREDYS